MRRTWCQSPLKSLRPRRPLPSRTSSPHSPTPLLRPKQDRVWRQEIEDGIARWWKVLEGRAMNDATPLNPQRVFWELSPREIDVLRLLPSTLSQREIAAELYVSFNTVRTHTRVIFSKLGVTSRAEAVSRARELGLI